MSGHRELTHSGASEGEWVDFPACEDPDPWGTLLGRADRFASPVSRDNHSDNNHWDIRRAGRVVATSFGIVFRGLLVTTGALAIVAFLLLTNSQI